MRKSRLKDVKYLAQSHPTITTLYHPVLSICGPPDYELWQDMERPQPLRITPTQGGA